MGNYLLRQSDIAFTVDKVVYLKIMLRQIISFAENNCVHISQELSRS